MELTLHADGRAAAGGSPLLMHNERASDPLRHTRAVDALARKRGKTEADHLELARRQYLAGIYTNGSGPCVPAINILRCLPDRAKRHRKGRGVLRGVYPKQQDADLQYTRPRSVDELWQASTCCASRWGSTAAAG